MAKLYPKAFEGRSSASDPQLQKSRKAFMKAAGTNFLLLQLLFLGIFCWIFGSLFQQNDHTHNISILFVDYDGGAVGAAVREAYRSLQGPTFPSLIERDHPDSSGSPATLQQAVCETDYWAALYVTRNSSARLQEALIGEPSVVGLNKSDILTYIWNQARYSGTVDSVVSSNIQTLSSTARVAYINRHGVVGDLNLTSPEALAVFADPWQLSSFNIQPTTQGSRAIYNTLVIILIQIQEFFYLGTLNGLFAGHKLYSRLSPHRMVIVRIIISLLYCLAGSLCVTGAIWAFRAEWNVDGKQFVLSWLVMWLFAHLNFLQLDVFSIWLPEVYIPMALISWIIFNATSIMLPFELSAGFYRVGYAAPAYGVYQVLVDIWSRGCNPQLHYALPTLFLWWMCGMALSCLGVYRRAHFAWLKEQEDARLFQARMDAAMQLEIQRDKELMERRGPASLAQDETSATEPEKSHTEQLA